MSHLRLLYTRFSKNNQGKMKLGLNVGSFGCCGTKGLI